MPELSIIIPTSGRSRKLAACVRALETQSLAPDRFEILIGVDGPDQGQTHSVAVAGTGRVRITVQEFERQGQAGIRNRLLEHARGDTLLFLNDDVIPDPCCAQVHLEEQKRQADAGRPALIIGDAPFRIHDDDRLFDRLIRETSMVFFYDQMPGSRAHSAAADHLHDAPVPAEPGHSSSPGTHDPDRDWGFRHAWTLNLSAPAPLVREVGGFSIFPETYGFEDDELAFRLRRRHATRVLFRPAALAIHDHRYEPAAYLERERRLGRAAVGFAASAPECATAMFGRDITADAEFEYSRAFVERERSLADRAREAFHSLPAIPATAIRGPRARALIAALYQQHLLLKRWEWRTGLLSARA